MTAPTFYFDDNIGWKDLITGLRQVGVTCVTSRDAGVEGAIDETHLRLAALNGYVVVTQDVKDFAALHWKLIASGESHAGILLVKQGGQSLGDLIRRIRRIAAEVPTEEFVGRLEYVTRWQPPG